MKWSENETYKFVKLYLKEESLWNRNSPSYKDKHSRIQAYRDIITGMRAETDILMSEDELKNKIKILRSTYIQELKKIKRRSGPDYTYRPAMKWFAEWHRCYESCKRYPMKTDKLQTEEENGESWLSGDEANDTINEDVDTDPFVSHTDDSYVYILKSEPGVEQCKTEISDTTYKAKRKKVKQRSPSIDNSDQTFRGSMDSSADPNKEDEFDIYGKYIASQLRQMDLQKALRLQLQIQGLVSEARISELTNK